MTAAIVGAIGGLIGFAAAVYERNWKAAAGWGLSAAWAANAAGWPWVATR